MTMEHKAWVPEGYEHRDSRILIVGHSHHKTDDKPDHENFTIDCVRAAAAGEMQIHPFFARQPRYLNLAREDYYNTVALINFPIAAVPHREASPTVEQIEPSRLRLIRVVQGIRPTHTFIMTPRYKFGRELPQTDEQIAGAPMHQIESEDHIYYYGHWTFGGITTLCAQLPHPQAAKTTRMQNAFSQLLAIA